MLLERHALHCTTWARIYHSVKYTLYFFTQLITFGALRSKLKFKIGQSYDGNFWQKKKVQKEIAEGIATADYAHDVNRNYAALVADEGDIEWARELFEKALETISECYDPLDAKRLIQLVMYQSIHDVEWALRLGDEILSDPNVSDQDKLAQAEFLIDELQKPQEGKAMMEQLAETSTDGSALSDMARTVFNSTDDAEATRKILKRVGDACEDPWGIFEAAYAAKDTVEDKDLVNWLCDKATVAAKGTDDEEDISLSVGDLRSDL